MKITRELIVRLVAFGLGSLVGALIAGHYLGKCQTRLVDIDTDTLLNDAQAALPAAMTGSGAVSFSFGLTGIRVHADSIFENQSYDAQIPAIVQGSPLTVEISSQLLRRMLSR
jgi:hypothetical protein